MPEDRKIFQAFVYILTNDRDNVIYVGSTEDLKKRIYFHKKGLIPGFTKKYNVQKLVHFEAYASVEQAQTREKYLKTKTRAKKFALIKESNPDLAELTPEITK